MSQTALQVEHAQAPGLIADFGIRPLWVSQLKGRAQSPLHFSIFMISPLTLLLTDFRLTSIILSYTDMFQRMVQGGASLPLQAAVLFQPL